MVLMIAWWSAAGAAVLLAAAFITDIRSMTIPNWLTVPCCAAGLLAHLAAGGWLGLGSALLGVSVGFALMYVLYVFGGVGAGDVKLFSALGAWTGVAGVWGVTMYSILFAGAAGFIILVWKKARRGKPLNGQLRLAGIHLKLLDGFNNLNGPAAAEEKVTIRFPFMLAVLPGAAVFWFAG
ncbi:A24 family peptidase [Paenibacillus sambharensis]|nr:prepilin peptidase [Paenibacillus sambharensis]